MKRRRGSGIPAAAGLALLLAAAGAAGAGGAAGRAARPNIVVIMADDLGWNHIGAEKPTLGTAHGKYVTPNIRKLAESGCSFPYAHMQANCAPTRACLLTGQYAPRHGVFNVTSLDLFCGDYKHRLNVQTQHRNLWPDAFTIARALHADGYATAHVGKYHVGGHGSRRGGLPADKGTSEATLPQNMGFDINIGGCEEGFHNNGCFAEKKNGRWVFPRFGKGAFNKYARPYTEADAGKYRLDWSIIGKDEKTRRKHVCDAVGDAAVETIRKLAAAGRPFYLQIHTYAVHCQAAARPDLKAAAAAWRPRADGPAGQAPGRRKIENYEPTDTYAGFVRGLDITVGRVRAALRDPDGDPKTDDGIEADTVLAFTSDNGGIAADRKSGEDQTRDNPNLPLNGFKGMHTEGGLRVPLILSWPGHIPADTVSARIVHAVDFYPTWLDFAGAGGRRPDPGKHPLDGFSFKDECLRPGSMKTPRPPVYWFFPGYLGRGPLPGGVRSTPLLTGLTTHSDGDVYRFTYVYETAYPEDATGWRLWNLTRDPYEKRDIAASSPATLHALAEAAVHWLWQTNSVENAVVRGWGVKPAPPPPRWDPRYPKKKGVEQRAIPIPPPCPPPQ